MELSPSYEPKEVEKKWYEHWEKMDYFHADANDGRKPYSIVIPPPNVTGNLHMGHALNNTLQDILSRWQRMNGKSVLWMPGTDHAGIATQNVVERLLAAEGKTKYDLGRGEFEKRVWKWKEHSGNQIQGQLKRLGSSCDWKRERFTLDEGLSRAVRKVFVTLYDEGLIYRGFRIINWCPRCETALSDIETEYRELEGSLWHIRYPLKDGGHLVVATTRPETMLGDTGVAVNPDDPRHAGMAGRTAILPLLNREIPVVADSFVDMEFGTGFVKVTPAHDPNDFEMGKRHGLEEIIIMDENAVINSNGGQYAGLDRYEARKRIVEDLERLGLLEKTEKHVHSVGHCYRCNTVIEPYLSMQWFVKIKPLADEAIRVVEDGSIRFVPKNWEKTYFEWMRNIRDWCISRQLWWGHRIPAFYCGNCGHIIVSMEDPSSCTKCASGNLTQDEDVLDTWFSSALWPFSTMGWPDKTPELDKYYPTSVLVTGFDIIFFWVARMIMTGVKFMGDIPFRDVYIHALVRDEHGQKMSKSKGNVIDPLIMMDRYGTDAFRFTLAAFAAQGRDIILSEKRIEGYRSFCNKIWNASRFILMNIGEDFKPQEFDYNRLEVFDKWILHSLNETARTVTEALDGYRFNEAAAAIYDFWWHRFCDWYLELVKQRIYAKSKSADESSFTARQVLYLVLRRALILLHPFMPFITEEIWSRIKSGDDADIIVSRWCGFEPGMVFGSESDYAGIFMEIIYRIRNIRGEMNIPPDRKADVVFRTSDSNIKKIIEQESGQIKVLARIETITIDPGYVPDKKDASAVIPGLDIFMPLSGLIDTGKEVARLEKEIAKTRTELDKIEAKLSNAEFTGKAPLSVIEGVKEKRRGYADVLAKLEESLSKLL